eukprot:12415414-Karenia_brevis.AAC.1
MSRGAIQVIGMLLRGCAADADEDEGCHSSGCDERTMVNTQGPRPVEASCGCSMVRQCGEGLYHTISKECLTEPTTL